tara:strand:- start:30106 stop:30516 length:411 start_codon:yes stop_codon:yes gene_type:complete
MKAKTTKFRLDDSKCRVDVTDHGTRVGIIIHHDGWDTPPDVFTKQHHTLSFWLELYASQGYLIEDKPESNERDIEGEAGFYDRREFDWSSGVRNTGRAIAAIALGLFLSSCSPADDSKLTEHANQQSEALAFLNSQ